MISVIVPVYNVEKFLDRCINSILTQTHKDFELILVDDGSTDKSGDICESYALTDNRIIVIHKQNGGLSSARNAGINIAKGGYLSFIDGDDYIAPVFLEKLYTLIQKGNAEISMVAPRIVDENGEEINYLSTGEQYVKYHPYKEEIITGHEVINRYFTMNNGFEFVTAWGKLYKRHVFSELLYPEGKNHEDEFVFIDAYKDCQNVMCCDDELYYYIQRIGGIMSSQKIRKRYEDMKSIHFHRTRIFRNNGLMDLLKLDCAQWLNQLIMLYIQGDSNIRKEIKKEYRVCYKNLKKLDKSTISLKHCLAYINIGIISQIRKCIK